MGVERFAVMNVVVRLDGDGIDSGAVLEAVMALPGVGDLMVGYACDYTQVDAVTAGPMDAVFWLYISPDEDVPYMATPCSERYGIVLSDDVMAALRQHGVVDAAYIEHPRADKYGYPREAVDEYAARGTVSEHGFRLVSSFDIDVNDTEDDSAESVWLKVLVDKAKVRDVFPDIDRLDDAFAEAEAEYLAHN